MKVAFLIHRIPITPGGGVKVIYEYANYMVTHGYDVTLYYKTENFMKRHKLLPRFLKILIGFFAIKYLIKWFPLEKKIKNKLCYSHNSIKKADIIFATEIRTVEWVNCLPDVIGKKGYFIQGFEDWAFSTEYLYKTYGYNMLKIVVSNWLKKIVDQYSITPAYLVSNCIDSNIFYNYGISRNKHSVVFHYRKASFKGCTYAITTVERLKERYNDLIVNVITTEKDIPSFPSYFNIFKSISPCEVSKINNQSEIFLCTSIKEGFGLPGLEAMGCGCVLVSSIYDGVLEYAVDDYNAFLVPARNVDAMVEKVSYLFETPDKMKELQNNGIKTAQEKSLQKSQKEFCDIIEKYCKNEE